MKEEVITILRNNIKNIITISSISALIIGFVKSSILKKVLHYIYDFCTFKKKWKLKIDYYILHKDSDENIKFTLYLGNFTYYDIEIQDIYLLKGKIFFEKYYNENGNHTYLEFCKYKYNSMIRLVKNNHLINNNQRQDWHCVILTAKAKDLKDNQIYIKYKKINCKKKYQFDISSEIIDIAL